MKNYEVTITEISEKTVIIQADSREEAEEIAEDRWNNSEYILNADDFKRAEFIADEQVRKREMER